MSFTANSKISLPQIFGQVKEAASKEAKLEILKRHYSVSTAAVLSLIFNPAIKISLPKGIPPDFVFTDKGALSLERAIRSFPAFVNAENNDRLQIGWLRLMRSLDKADAEFAFALKDRTVDVGLSQEEVHEAFPTLIPAPTKGSQGDAKEPVAPAKAEVPATPATPVVTEPAAAPVVPAVLVPDEFPDADEAFGGPSTISDEGVGVPDTTVKKSRAKPKPKKAA